MFTPLFRVEIPRTQFTLDYAVNTLIELHSRFRFDHIALDRGYGDAQVETIKKHGVKNPETKLHIITEGFHFGSSLEVRDPHTGKKVKRDFKPFMVENSVRVFERNKVALYEKDKVLKRQLTSYRIKTISSTGRPIFTDVDEHSVDTLNLCLLVFSMKYEDLFKAVLKGSAASVKLDRAPKEEFLERTELGAKTNKVPVGITGDHKIIYATVPRKKNINRNSRPYKRRGF